jgi:hypothetical protein
MGQVWPCLIFTVVLTAVLGALTRLAARTRRRGVGLEVMGPVDQIYRPHTYEINREIRTQEQRGVAVAPAGDNL